MGLELCDSFVIAGAVGLRLVVGLWEGLGEDVVTRAVVLFHSGVRLGLGRSVPGKSDKWDDEESYKKHTCGDFRI